MNESRRFLVLWTLATIAAAAAFSLHLGLRVKTVELGYELGRAHAHVARLREVKRVLELEIASHKTPERVDIVARTLFGMSEPSPDRIIPAGELPVVPASEESGVLAPVVASASPVGSGVVPDEEPMEAPEPPAPTGPFAALPAEATP